MWELCRYVMQRIHKMADSKLLIAYLMESCVKDGTVFRFPTDKEILEAMEHASILAKYEE